jgi:SDR family mycofactocin-dependent oxidoreductase
METKMLEGKVVMITGGARGQGRAHAVVSAREGADIVVTDIADQIETAPYDLASSADLKETVAQVEALGRRAQGIEADVRSQDQMDAAVQQALDHFGKIDVLIANAGTWSIAPFWELTDQQWDDTVDVCLSGVWKSAKAVTPHMIERQAGSIIIISSINGIRPNANYAHYIAAKFGVVGLMQAIALELAPHGIRCNAIHPGCVDTPIVRHQAAYDLFAGHPGGTPDLFLEAGYRTSALKGRTWLHPDEIAKTALYLNSDLAANVTGQSISVDSGGGLLPRFNHNPIRD